MKGDSAAAGAPGAHTALYCLTAAPAAIATSGSASDLATGSIPAGRFGTVNATGAVTSSGATAGVGYASGDGRSLTAARNAISSPMLEASIEGARGIILNVSGGSDLGLLEVNEAAEVIHGVCHPDANIIFGAVIDDDLGDEVDWILDRLGSAGIGQVVAVDLTRPEIGVPVVRVVVPGLEGSDHLPDYTAGERARAVEREP